MKAEGNESSGPLHHWLRMQPSARAKVYNQIFASSGLEDLDYWLMILLSAGIATLGLVLNSPAVIIGAMLISPLMGPIMAAGLGMAVGDLYLTARAAAKLLLSMLVAVGLSAALVALLPFHSETTEILARTNPTLLDLGIALLSGFAGSFAVTRAASGNALTTLPGVAIAVALMPPLCTIGFGIGNGNQHSVEIGAGLLFLTNIVAIVSTAFLVFVSAGLNSLAVRHSVQESRAGDRFADWLSKGPLRSAMANGGRLRWRVAVLLVLLLALGVPLRAGLKQVAGEAAARDAVQKVVKTLAPSSTLLSQQTQVGKSTVSVQLVVTTALDPNKLHAAEAEIRRRSGRATTITATRVASQSDFTELMDKLQRAPIAVPPAVPVPESLEDVRKKVLGRIQPALQDVWPAEAPLSDVQVAFTGSAVAIETHYQAKQDLPPVALELITKLLQQKIGDPGLQLIAQRDPAPPSTSPAKKSHRGSRRAPVKP